MRPCSKLAQCGKRVNLQKIFREIDSQLPFSVKLLLSRNFCQKKCAISELSTLLIRENNGFTKGIAK